MNGERLEELNERSHQLEEADDLIDQLEDMLPDVDFSEARRVREKELDEVNEEIYRIESEDEEEEEEEEEEYVSTSRHYRNY